MNNRPNNKVNDSQPEMPKELSSGAGPLKILVVEDSRTQALEMKRLLEKTGFAINLAENGQAALEQISRDRPNLVISDVVMPGMDGYELCRTIRANEELRDLPVILLTSLSEPEDIFSGLDCGADNFVAKPFDADYLICRIQFLVSNAALRDRDRMNFGIEVLFGGKRHFVSANRVQILHHLLSTYETTMLKTRELEKAQRQLRDLNNELEARVAERTAALQAEVEERKRAQAELSHRLRIEAALATVSSRFIGIQPDGMDAALEASLQEIGQAMNVDCSFIWRLNDDGTVSVPSHLWCGPGVSAASMETVQIPLSQCSWCLEKLKAKAVISIGDPSELPEGAAAIRRLASFQSLLIVPIYAGEERLLGALGFATLQKRDAWLAPNVTLVKVVSEVFAKAIESQRGQELIREQANLLDLATDSIIERSMDGRILFWNRGAERLYGLRREEVQGKVVVEQLYKDPVKYEDIVGELLEKGELQAEVVQLNKSGEEIIVNKQWTLVHDAKGQPKSILSIGSNITERKTLEKQFYQAQKQESLGSLASGIAHDFNNLLAIINGYTELIAEQAGADVEIQKLTREVLGAGRRAGLLVRQILTFARQTEPDLHPIEVNSLVEEIVTVAQATFPRRITITPVLANHLLTLSGDPTQIYQVLMNLLVNARDAIPNEGSIEVRTFSSTSATGEECIYIQVTDTGGGMPPELLERIREPFFTTKPKGEGTGLGLPVVEGIVKSHGGKMEVASELNRGSAFTLSFPASKSKGKAASEGRNETQSPTGQKQKILVVDDEPAIREMVALVLGHSGYQVTKATNGREALSLLESGEQFDLVLADHDMPVASGAELYSEIRARGISCEFILLSGYIAPEILNRLKRAGLHWYLDKPVAVHEILSAVAHALE